MSVSTVTDCSWPLLVVKAVANQEKPLGIDIMGALDLVVGHPERYSTKNDINKKIKNFARGSGTVVILETKVTITSPTHKLKPNYAYAMVERKEKNGRMYVLRLQHQSL